MIGWDDRSDAVGDAPTGRQCAGGCGRCVIRADVQQVPTVDQRPLRTSPAETGEHVGRRCIAH